jgi:uncharacterized protein (TIGR02145 family)
MKKAVLIFLLSLAMLKTQSQNYLISFAGTGDTVQIATVKVENLNSGATLTLDGGDILHLVPPVGISPFYDDKESLSIFPNPQVNKSIVKFSTTENENVMVSITDVSGRILCSNNLFLSQGTHTFSVSGLHQGVYFVQANGNGFDYSAKLISQNIQARLPEIAYISSSREATKASPVKSSKSTVDMPYTDGDQLLFTGNSGRYNNIVPDIPAGDKIITFTFNLCEDNDGHTYKTVLIGPGKAGTQTWMAENVRTTTYTNGDAIPNVTDGPDWIGLATGAYCWYNNNKDSFDIPYGKLYNWFAVQDSRGLCPVGWHVPSNTEWVDLLTCLGGDTLAGGKLKESGTSHWMVPNTGATNMSGFTGLPGGLRYTDALFVSIYLNAYFWTSTENSATKAQCYVLNANQKMAYGYSKEKIRGHSLRCIKD